MSEQDPQPTIRVSSQMKTLTPPSPPPRRIHLSHHLTLSAFASFQASRKPPSIVKSILGLEASSPPDAPNATAVALSGGRLRPHRLGELDLDFLFSYSAGMYIAGHSGDWIDLRRFPTFGMLGSGVTTVAFRHGYFWGIHRPSFFLSVQIVDGLFQSIGWPCAVAVVGNWFGKSKRGLIMGVWNSHTSVGNILGTVLASAVFEYGWGWSKP